MADSQYLRDKLAAVITEATHVSLHTDDPAGTGAAEVVGGAPAYARVAITSWAVTADGVVTATLAGPFDVPADTDVLFAGLWNLDTYLDKAPCVFSTTTQDQVTIQTLTFTVPPTDSDVTAA